MKEDEVIANPWTFELERVRMALKSLKKTRNYLRMFVDFEFVG
jgi:hypothetical protein